MRYLAQHFITRYMAHGIIDHLELIQVDIQQNMLSKSFHGFKSQLLESLIKSATIP